MIAPSITANSPVVQFTQAGDHRVCFVKGGNESSSSRLRDKPRLLLLHGWISSHQLYRECWPWLDEMAHFRAVDLIGFGDSDKPSPKTCRYDPAWYGEQLKAFVDSIGWNKFILIAHSMGGIAATEFAVAHPQFVDRLILVDSAGIVQPPPLLGRILQLPVVGSFLFQLLAGTRKCLRNFMVNDVWYAKSVVEDEVLNNLHRVINSPGGKEAAYAAMMRMVSPEAARDFTNRFSELTCKTHLIWGDRDRLFPLDSCGRMLERLIPNATIDIIEECGHEPPVEAPERFLQILEKLIFH
ncbi:MAG: alpha/beta hydrolase [Aureliella sp.]